jgi:ankyrin repeat protein
VRGHTALHRAVISGRAEAVQALLLVGADPTIKDEERKTPRTLAEEKGHGECVDIFEVSMPQSHCNAHNAQQCRAS